MTSTDQGIGTLEPEAGLLAEPTFEECQGEFCRFMEDQSSLDLGNKYPDEFVAYSGARIVDHDRDPTALRARAAASLEVHPARLILYFVHIAFWAE